MKDLEKIKDELAQECGYENYDEVLFKGNLLII